MTKTIVVALDRSPLAERALGPASWLARELHADVRLVTVTLDVEASDEEVAYLAAQAGSLGVEHVDQEVIRHDLPAAGIAETVAVSPDAAVCMTTRGRGGLAELLLGSVADEVLCSVDAPVVLIGPNCSSDVPATKRVVISVDGSDESAAVYGVAAEWARSLGAEVDVVTVAQTGEDRPDDLRAAAAHRIVDQAASDLADLGVEAVPQVLLGADVPETVVQFAAGLPAALVAIGTHGESGLSVRALGRVATEIVRSSSCPVLVRRAPG